MTSNKTNYKNGSILDQDIKQWNDYTIDFEIHLCREALYGCDEYSLRGLLREPPTNNVCSAIDTWVSRLSRVLHEAKDRKLISQKEYATYRNELDIKMLALFTPSTEEL